MSIFVYTKQNERGRTCYLICFFWKFGRALALTNSELNQREYFQKITSDMELNCKSSRVEKKREKKRKKWNVFSPTSWIVLSIILLLETLGMWVEK